MNIEMTYFLPLFPSEKVFFLCCVFEKYALKMTGQLDFSSLACIIWFICQALFL